MNRNSWMAAEGGTIGVSGLSPFRWWAKLMRLGRTKPRRLRLCESLPLGERRFVAVIEFEETRFLVGSTPGSLTLLAQLGAARGAAGDREMSDRERES